MVQCDLGIKTLESTARKVDQILKTLPKTDAYRFRHKSSLNPVTEIETVNRTEISTITTSVMDRDRDIVLANGIELSDFQLNPIVLYSHERTRPVGRALWIKAEGDGLKAKTEYTTRPKKYEGEWFPDFVFSMIQADVLRGKSIGFLPLEIREPEIDEIELYPDVQCVIVKSLLLEFSVVSVPSNPFALLEEIGKGIGLDHWQFKVLKTPQPVKPKPELKVKITKIEPRRANPEKIANLAWQKFEERWSI